MSIGSRDCIFIFSFTSTQSLHHFKLLLNINRVNRHQTLLRIIKVHGLSSHTHSSTHSHTILLHRHHSWLLVHWLLHASLLHSHIWLLYHSLLHTHVWILLHLHVVVIRLIWLVLVLHFKYNCAFLNTV